MKKVVLISSVLLTFVIGVYFYYYSDSQKYVLENASSYQKVISSNSLTMMYETDYQSGEYQVSSDNAWPQDGYVFNETLSKCENGGILTWDDENKKVLLQTNISDKCFVYFDKEPGTLASYIINNVYTGTDGDNGLYYHDGVGSYTNADQEAGDYSYRYSGASEDVNNYVCFGSKGVTCSEENLYRIIGVFNNQVKLIKATSYGDYVWDVDDNTWNEATKPDIYTTLNTTYWNNIDLLWKELIDTDYNWHVGGFSFSGVNTANDTYNAEIRDNEGYIETMPIGLMYLSDYSYASMPSVWVTSPFDLYYPIRSNWLFAYITEWTLSRSISNASLTYVIDNPGYSTGSGVYQGYATTYKGDWNFSIRPCFYLNSDVQYISGSGTQTDPYRID